MIKRKHQLTFWPTVEPCLAKAMNEREFSDVKPLGVLWFVQMDGWMNFSNKNLYDSQGIYYLDMFFSSWYFLKLAPFSIIMFIV